MTGSLPTSLAKTTAYHTAIKVLTATVVARWRRFEQTQCGLFKLRNLSRFQVAYKGMIPHEILFSVFVQKCLLTEAMREPSRAL